MTELNPARLVAAYDHIVIEMLKLADDGGAVRRAAVDRHVDALRKEGRGGEALAAELLFRMVDYVDHERPGAVNRDRFAFARAFIKHKVAAFSRGAPLSPSLRALAEVGAILDIAARPGRVAYRVPEQGMEHIAALLDAQADAFQVINRPRRDLLVYDLYEQGRGTEALAVRYFFNFTDHRTPDREGGFNRKELAGSVEYAREKLLRQKDANRNGYSADEIAKFSTTALTFLHVGQMIEAGVIS